MMLIRSNPLWGPRNGKRPLDMAMLREELEQTVPLSVTRREDVARLRDLAEGRFVPVV